MVADDDAGGAVARCEDRVGRALYPLDYDGDVRPDLLSDPGHFGPAQRGVDVGAHEPAEATALCVGGLLRRGGGAVGESMGLRRLEAFVGLALAGDGGVNRDYQAGEGRVQGAEVTKECGGLVAVAVDVELKEDRVRGGGRVNGVDGVRCIV